MIGEQVNAGMAQGLSRTGQIALRPVQALAEQMAGVPFGCRAFSRRYPLRANRTGDSDTKTRSRPAARFSMRRLICRRRLPGRASVRRLRSRPLANHLRHPLAVPSLWRATCRCTGMPHAELPVGRFQLWRATRATSRLAELGPMPPPAPPVMPSWDQPPEPPAMPSMGQQRRR